MELMSLTKRFLGSAIDKVFILILYPTLLSLFFGGFKTASMLGTFVGSGLISSPSSQTYVEEYIRKTTPSTSEIDFYVVITFVIFNLLYYTIFEFWLKASLGKKIFGGALVDSNNDKIKIIDVLMRNCIVLILMVIFSRFRYYLDTSYIVIIILFFMIVDIPVYFKKKSLIDIISRTKYVKNV